MGILAAEFCVQSAACIRLSHDHEMGCRRLQSDISNADKSHDGDSGGCNRVVCAAICRSHDPAGSAVNRAEGIPGIPVFVAFDYLGSE